MPEVDLMSSPPEDIAAVLRYMLLEALIFMLIPILAAPMARAGG